MGIIFHHQTKEIIEIDSSQDKEIVISKFYNTYSPIRHTSKQSFKKPYEINQLMDSLRKNTYFNLLSSVKDEKITCASLSVLSNM